MNNLYVRISPLSGIRGLFNKKLWLFRTKALSKTRSLQSLRALARRPYEMKEISDVVIPKVYDVEYSGSEGPNYAYLSPLLFKRDFRTITGFAPIELSRMKIIDIGAGSNELLRFLRDELHVPSENLSGSDVSEASKEIILKDGFQGHVGRIEDLHFPESSFDIAFLTYFIDYDTNQQKTFEEVVRIVRPGGKIILEGKFPVKPLGLSATDRNDLTFITRGNSAEEDVDLVRQAFIEIGQSQNKEISVERVVASERYVYSRFGLCQLPSYFLVFKAGD